MTAEELLWKCVKHTRWYNSRSSFVADVFSCYLDFPVIEVRRRRSNVLLLTVENEYVDNFRHVFPLAEVTNERTWKDRTKVIKLRIPGLVVLNG